MEPDKIGSLTPKNVGTTDARPIAQLRFDFVNHEHKWNSKSRTSTTQSNNDVGTW